VTTPGASQSNGIAAVAIERDASLSDCCPGPLDLREAASVTPANAQQLVDDVQQLVDDDDTLGAAEVEAEPVERVTTPLGLDALFGAGGMPLARVVLVGGDRGSGKTRLVSQLLAFLGSVDRPSIFGSAEDMPRDVVQRFHEVLDVDELHNVRAFHMPAGGGVAAFAAMVRRRRPVVAAIDSVQAAAGELPGPQGDAARALWELSRETGTTIVELSQMNAAGHLRGSKATEQWCDVILHVECPPDDVWLPEDAAHVDAAIGQSLCLVRVAGKNRHGPRAARVKLKHTAHGLRPLQEKQKQ
jgi:predicted ATP-dependent serine protease